MVVEVRDTDRVPLACKVCLRSDPHVGLVVEACLVELRGDEEDD